MGLNTICYQIGILILFQVQEKVQNLYEIDYGKGGQIIYSIFFGIMALYWVVLTGYVIKYRK
jgi:hypothetical protein